MNASSDNPALPALPDAPRGRYRHYKGGEYELLGVVRHSETLEPLVLYRPLYDNGGISDQSWRTVLSSLFVPLVPDMKLNPLLVARPP